jgi:hypothetical protein
MKNFVNNFVHWCALILSALSIFGCVRNIDITYKDISVIPVQFYTDNGEIAGEVNKYLRVNLESQEDLAALDEAILQFRGTVVLSTGERLLVVGTGAIEEKPYKYIPLERIDKQTKPQDMYRYSAFFFRNLKLDYEGRRIVDLLNDDYTKVEFYVSYKIFAGPEIGRSKTMIMSKDDIINVHRSQSDSEHPIYLLIY